MINYNNHRGKMDNLSKNISKDELIQKDSQRLADKEYKNNNLNYEN